MSGRSSDKHRCLAATANGETIAATAMPGSVQFYDVSRDSHVADLAVVPHLYTSKFQSNVPTNPSRVELLELSFDGKFLVTLDRQGEAEGLAAETSLKFWFLDPDTQRCV